MSQSPLLSSQGDDAITAVISVDQYYHPENTPTRSGIVKIRSNSFASTIQNAGIRKQFKTLQNTLAKISKAQNFIHEYASGQMFEELISAFTTEPPSIFSNTTLFGEIDNQQNNVINDTREQLRRTSIVINDIDDALTLMDAMYKKVNRILDNTQSTYFSRDKRSETLISWALRKGVKLNPKAEAYPGLVIGNANYVSPTDLWGLLDMIDTIRLELETLKTLPAYYRTGTDASNQNIQTPVRTIRANKHQSIESLAQNELDNADKVNTLLEFNQLDYNDVQGDKWDGKEINIPDSDRFSDAHQNNMVLDKHTGDRILGRDLSNQLTTANGDVKVLKTTDTFFQAIDNIIRTPYGSVIDSPQWGSRAPNTIGDSMGNMKKDISGIEIARAIQTDPRVNSVSDVKVTQDRDTYRVNYKVQAINSQQENQLTSNLDAS